MNGRTPAAPARRRWVPAPRLSGLLFVPLSLAAVGILIPALFPWVWLLDGGIALLLLLDGLAVAGARVDVRRRAPNSMFLGQPHAVELVVSHSAERPLELSVTDDVMAAAQVVGLPVRLTVAPDSAVTVEYSVTPARRGTHHLGAHHVRVVSPLRLWFLQLEISAEAQLRVYPRAQRLLQPRRLLPREREPGWLQYARALGGESEFARLRDYTRDDEYRAIDWKTTARRRTLTAREYQVESNQRLCFVLDCSRRMTATTGGSSLLDYAIESSLALAAVAHRHGDRIGLLGFDERLAAYLPPTSGPGAMQRLAHAVYDLEPSLVEADYELALRAFAAHFPQRSLLILFTQVVDEAVADQLLRHVTWLSKRHLPLLILLRHPGLEAVMRSPASEPLDWYVRGAAAELMNGRQKLLRRLRQRGALVLDVHPEQLTPRLVQRYLQVKARHWL